jgi:hypothetical protein
MQFIICLVGDTCHLHRSNFQLHVTFPWELHVYHAYHVYIQCQCWAKNFQVQHGHIYSENGQFQRWWGASPNKEIRSLEYTVGISVVGFHNSSLLLVTCWHFSAICYPFVPYTCIFLQKREQLQVKNILTITSMQLISIGPPEHDHHHSFRSFLLKDALFLDTGVGRLNNEKPLRRT